MNIIEKAYQFAKEKHRDTVDDNGQPFFEAHPVQVADIITIIAPSDLNLIAAGYLHDTVEDTDTNYDELVHAFNKDVADLVLEVTHEGQKDEKGYYFPRLQTKRGIILKFADRLSNLSRMEAWDNKRQEHYLRKSKFWKS